MRAFPVRLPSGARYWTVLDEDLAIVAVADSFLRQVRFGRDGAESTTRAHAGSIALFLRWCARSGRAWPAGIEQLGLCANARIQPPPQGPTPGEPRVGELLPARSVQGDIRRGRPPCLESADALDTRQVRGQAPARDESTPPSLLRPGVEIRLQRGRLHRRIQRRRDPVPLPRQHHRDPMDPGTRSRHQQRLTSGQDTGSARCGESRTPGAGGGLRETTGGNTGTAPAGPPHHLLASPAARYLGCQLLRQPHRHRPQDPQPHPAARSPRLHSHPRSGSLTHTADPGG